MPGERDYPDYNRTTDPTIPYVPSYQGIVYNANTKSVNALSYYEEDNALSLVNKQVVGARFHLTTEAVGIQRAALSLKYSVGYYPIMYFRYEHFHESQFLPGSGAAFGNITGYKFDIYNDNWQARVFDYNIEIYYAQVVA